MAKTKYNLHLKGYVGGWDFDSDYVDFVLNKNTDKEVAVIIDSLGGQPSTLCSLFALAWTIMLTSTGLCAVSLEITD